jgi:molecular chaperone GrpE
MDEPSERWPAGEQGDSEGYLALAQRTQADFENYRKRMARDLAAARARGAAQMATAILPALDDLDRALEHCADEGVRMVCENMRRALADEGVEAFSPLGQPFDPARHEALSARPEPGVEQGVVLEVALCGYAHGEAVLRPARVVVSA